MTSRKLDTTVFDLWGKTLKKLRRKNDSIPSWSAVLRAVHEILDGGWKLTIQPITSQWGKKSLWKLTASLSVFDHVCVCVCVSFWSCVSPFRVCSYLCLVLCVCGSSKKSGVCCTICSTSVASYFSKQPHGICTSYIHFIYFGYSMYFSISMSACTLMILIAWGRVSPGINLSGLHDSRFVSIPQRTMQEYNSQFRHLQFRH